MSTDAHIPTITAFSIPVLRPSAVHNIKGLTQYLLQKCRESWCAECSKEHSDRVEINAWDLWVGTEVSIITKKANKNRIFKVNIRET